jgi:hypothetical protein
LFDSGAQLLIATSVLSSLLLPQPCVFSKQAPAATMGYKGSRPCCETGKPVYDGIVSTRLPRQAGAAAAGACSGTAK